MYRDIRAGLLLAGMVGVLTVASVAGYFALTERIVLPDGENDH